MNKILVVDDSEFFLEFIKSLLSRSGCVIITANDVWIEKQYCAAAEKQFNGDQFDSPFAPRLDQHYQGFIYPPDFRGAGTGQTVILDVPQFDHIFLTVYVLL